MRIAVIGSGIAGLTAAYSLHRRHDVTVFEAADYVGGHTRTVDVEVDGRSYAIDTGFIVFNERHYPNFTALLDGLGVSSKPTVMNFSVRSDRSGVEYASASLNAVFAQRRNLLRPTFRRMLRDILRFNRMARSNPLPDDRMTVAEYTEQHGFSRAFVDEYLVPLGASLWSSPPRRFRTFSIRFVIEFLGNHAMLQLSGQPVWRVVRGGSQRYVDALLARFSGEVLLGRPIERVRRLADRVSVRDASGAEAAFDHVILACHADQALRMLADPSPAEREVLGAFPYQRNDVLLHTDPTVLPRTPRARASWNYHVPADDRDTVSVTYNMNRLQGLQSPHLFNVTLNDSGLVRPERVLRRFIYEHPIFSPGRDAAQRRHDELIDINRTSFCGAYWGFGFHEDGVRSGLAVATQLERLVAA
jgi:predicted NAD/FAD-binding protein